MPAALAIAALSIISIRRAYRKMRIGDVDAVDRGAIEQTFWASFWIGLAAWVYPYAIVLIAGVWFAFLARRMLPLRAWMASFLALALCALWYWLSAYFQNW